jgi:hypothetical protein
MNKENLNNIGVELDGEIIFVTVAKYKLFMHYGKVGMDALILYMHYMFTARLQYTNSVKANSIYCRSGLGWTKTRFQKAKNLLMELELISNIVRKDDKGKIVGSFIAVKTTTTPFEFKEIPASTDPKTHPPANPPAGKMTTNALTNNRNALTKKRNAYTGGFLNKKAREISDEVKRKIEYEESL